MNGWLRRGDSRGLAGVMTRDLQAAPRMGPPFQDARRLETSSRRLFLSRPQGPDLPVSHSLFPNRPFPQGNSCPFRIQQPARSPKRQHNESFDPRTRLPYPPRLNPPDRPGGRPPGRLRGDENTSHQYWPPLPAVPCHALCSRKYTIPRGIQRERKEWTEGTACPRDPLRPLPTCQPPCGVARVHFVNSAADRRGFHEPLHAACIYCR